MHRAHVQTDCGVTPDPLRLALIHLFDFFGQEFAAWEYREGWSLLPNPTQSSEARGDAHTTAAQLAQIGPEIAKSRTLPCGASRVLLVVPILLDQPGRFAATASFPIEQAPLVRSTAAAFMNTEADRFELERLRMQARLCHCADHPVS